MAVGEVISEITATIGSMVSFQPAATVEIMVLYIVGNGTLYAGLNNGVIDTYQNQTANTGRAILIKMGITNSLYLEINASATGAAYSGIQIK